MSSSPLLINERINSYDSEMPRINKNVCYYHIDTGTLGDNVNLFFRLSLISMANREVPCGRFEIIY